MLVLNHRLSYPLVFLIKLMLEWMVCIKGWQNGNVRWYMTWEMEESDQIFTGYSTNCIHKEAIKIALSCIQLYHFHVKSAEVVSTCSPSTWLHFASSVKGKICINFFHLWLSHLVTYWEIYTFGDDSDNSLIPMDLHTHALLKWKQPFCGRCV